MLYHDDMTDTHGNSKRPRSGGRDSAGSRSRDSAGSRSRDGAGAKSRGAGPGSRDGAKSRDGAPKSRSAAGGKSRAGEFKTREGGAKSRDGGFKTREGGFKEREGGFKAGGFKDGKPRFARDGARKPAPRKAPVRAPQEDDSVKTGGFERIAKAMARAGACSRREAEAWIAEGRVAVNGKVLESPAFNVGPEDKIMVDGRPLAARERTRMFLFHKPRGLVTTDRDPEGRHTVFEYLAERHPDLPRLMSIGRLDINTEGLLLLTNDGGLARVLELPATGWLRRYRVRAFGETDQAQLDTLQQGVTIDGVNYAPIDAKLERQQGSNVWISIGLREGKNREVRKTMGDLGLEVNRLIRVSYGPFQLGDIPEGAVEEVKTRVLRDQLGPALIAQAAADFDAPTAAEAREARKPERASTRERGDGKRAAPRGERGESRPARSGERAERAGRPEFDEAPPRRDRPAPAGRKHVDTMRAERAKREADPEERVKRVRSATQDRNGREIVVERVISAKPTTQTRNGRRFNAEKPPTGRPRKRFGEDGKETRARGDGERPPRRARFAEDGAGQARRPRAEGAERSDAKPRFSRDGAPRREGPAPRREGEQRQRSGGDRTGGDRPFRSGPARAGGAPRSERSERPTGPRGAAKGAPKNASKSASRSGDKAGPNRGGPDRGGAGRTGPNRGGPNRGGPNRGGSSGGGPKRGPGRGPR